MAGWLTQLKRLGSLVPVNEAAQTSHINSQAWPAFIANNFIEGGKRGWGKRGTLGEILGTPSNMTAEGCTAQKFRINYY